MKKVVFIRENTHDFVFDDMTDNGDEIIKTYTCSKCGAKRTDVYTLSSDSRIEPDTFCKE